jgi:hypothetical protein
MFATLLEANLMSDVRALQLIAAMRGSRGVPQGRALVAIAALLSTVIVPRAIELAREVEDEPARADALLALAQRLPAEARVELVEQVAELAIRLPDNDLTKPYQLCRIMEHAPARRTLLADAAFASAMQTEDPYDRVQALALLLADVPGAWPAFCDALGQARPWQDPDRDYSEFRVSLPEILDSVPTAKREEVAAMLLGVVEELPDLGEKALSLATLAGSISESERSRVVAAALAATHSLDDFTMIGSLLLELSAHADDARRTELVAEAERWIRRTADPMAQAEGLVRLAREIPVTLAREHVADVLRLIGDLPSPAERVERLTMLGADQPPELRDVMLEHAARLVPEIPERFTKAVALIKIGRAWSGARGRQFVRDGVRMPGGILALGHADEDDVERVELLAALARDLETPARFGIAEVARGISETVAQDYDRGRAFASILGIVASDERPGLSESVLAIAMDLHAPYQRAELLTKVLPYAVGDDRKALFDAALAAARAIELGHITLNGSIDMLTGKVTLDRASPLVGRPARALLHLALTCEAHERADLIEEAVRFVFACNEERLQLEALTELAEHLSPAQAEEFLETYRTLVGDPLVGAFVEIVFARLAALRNVGSEGATAEAPDTLAGGDRRDDGAEGSLRRYSIRWTLPLRVSPSSIFEVAFDPPVFASDDRKAELELSALQTWAEGWVVHQGVETLESVETAWLSLRGARWHRAAGRLLKKLTGESRERALQLARSTWPEHVPPEVLATLAWWPDAQTPASGLTEASGHPAAFDRATALLELLPHLDDAGRQVALEGIEEAMSGPFSPGELSDVCGTVTKALDTVPDSLVLTHVQRLPRLTETRQELLAAMHASVPLIKHLAGAAACEKVATAVVDGTKWVR